MLLIMNSINLLAYFFGGKALIFVEQSLLKYETLTGVEIKDILAGKKIKRSKGAGKKTLKSALPS